MLFFRKLKLRFFLFYWPLLFVKNVNLIDTLLVANNNFVFFSAFSKKDPALQPRPRDRSLSATEASKPASLSHRPHTGNT